MRLSRLREIILHRFINKIFLIYSLIHVNIVVAREEQTCLNVAADGTCIKNDQYNYQPEYRLEEEWEEEENYDEDCEDLKDECQFWADKGECEENPEYMLEYCALSCNNCIDGGKEEDFGVIQLQTQHAEDIEKALEEMKAYFLRIRLDPTTSPKMHEVLDNCKNKHESCAFWKILGECENNPFYMKIECAAVCKTCENLSIETRCPIDPNAPRAWKPGDLHTMFTNITTLPQFQMYEPQIHSRPADMESEESDGPWVITLENFLTEEEANRLIELGAEEGYERSSDVGSEKFDGTVEQNVNSGRTSTNSWCQNQCYEDEIAKRVIQKITDITAIPEANSEYLQLLRYEVGQFYQTHHDYIPMDNDRQQGVRLLTVFLYLNDVEAGGGTNFPLLDITIMPKRGRALIWPSVLNDHPSQSDERTYHQALRVEAGIKYGANAWIHMHDFKTPNRNNCQ